MNKPLISLVSVLTLSIIPLVAQTSGNLTSERWNNLPASLSILTLQKEGVSIRPADTTTLLAGAEWAPNQGDNYGLRLRGTVTAPVTGT